MSGMLRRLRDDRLMIVRSPPRFARYPWTNMVIDPTLVTTGLDLPGYRIVRNLGMVRGIVVRSRSVVGTIGASLQTLVGGNITLFTELCETTREDAYEL